MSDVTTSDSESCSHWREGDSDDCLLCGDDLGPTTMNDVTTTEPSVGTRRQIAESIARRGLPFSAFKDKADYEQTKLWIINAIDTALKDQMEKDAELAEKCHEQPCICHTCLIHAEAGMAIRREIRKE